MINPERVQKGDLLYLAGDCQQWSEVEQVPWSEQYFPNNPDCLHWRVGVWCHRETWGGNETIYMPVSLALATILIRDDEEVWNVAEDPAQLPLFEED